MKTHVLGKKRRRIVALLLVLAVGIGFTGYCIFGVYKLDELASMTFEEMLAYTTKENADAVITVGIIRDGKMTYDVYGKNGILMSRAEHTYEIGSITKTFTAALLCKAISEGRISLDDTIDQYLDLPKRADYPTIRRLVTHTAGYHGYYFEKPMIANFLRGRNDFFGISEDMLLHRIGKIRLGEMNYPFAYSNFGMAVLGAMLEQTYDEDYTALMNTFIREELKLEDTMVSDGSCDLGSCWDWSADDAYMPAGALVSDITDMMQYLQMQMGAEIGYLSMGHEVLAEGKTTSGSYEKMGIRVDAVGAGWMIDQQNHIIWHNGGTGNFNSYIGFDKDKQAGVVILSNLPPNDRIPATVMGIELLTSLQKG